MPGLDQLVLAPARRLEGERRRVQEDGRRLGTRRRLSRDASHDIDRERRCSSRSSHAAMRHAEAPVLLCFHHLRPRLSRLESEDRGMSSSGVTVSQSSAVRTARFKLNVSRSIVGGSQSRVGWLVRS